MPTSTPSGKLTPIAGPKAFASAVRSTCSPPLRNASVIAAGMLVKVLIALATSGVAAPRSVRIDSRLAANTTRGPSTGPAMPRITPLSAVVENANSCLPVGEMLSCNRSGMPGNCMTAGSSS